MKSMKRWLPHSMYLGTGLISILIAAFFSAHFLRSAHAQFDGDPASPANAPPTAPSVIGENPPPAPPPVQQAAQAEAAPVPAPPPPGENPPSVPSVANNPPQPVDPAQAGQMPPPNPPTQNAQPPAPAKQPPLESLQQKLFKGPQAPVPVAVPAPVQPPVDASKSLSEVTFLEPYVFDMREGRRNPFQAPPLVDASTSASSVASLPGTPLERYELEEIKLVGIMWQIKAPKAMFIDPQGEVHVLTKDDRIGRKHGYIAAIREGEVVIVEPGNVVGESAFSTRILQLDKDQKDKR
jgi:Tfp pilus assembly protein PilP